MVVGAKNGEALDKADKLGDSIGGFFGLFVTVSDRIHGPVDRCSETADRTGDSGSGFDCASCCPSA